MRKIMICASVVLALFQLWPVVFGHRTSASAARQLAAAAPHAMAAVATDTALPRIIPVSTVPAQQPKSCYQQYRARFARCSAGDRTCHAKTADDWDLCEATGLWPS